MYIYLELWKQGQIKVSSVSLTMYLGGWVGFKQGRETEKKDKQRERVNKWKEKRKKKLTFLLVFISSTFLYRLHLRRILQKVVKIALTTFSKIQLYIQPHWNNILNLFIELRCSEIFIKLHYWLLHLSDLSVALIFVGLCMALLPGYLENWRNGESNKERWVDEWRTVIGEFLQR